MVGNCVTEWRLLPSSGCLQLWHSSVTLMRHQPQFELLQLGTPCSGSHRGFEMGTCVVVVGDVWQMMTVMETWPWQRRFCTACITFAKLPDCCLWTLLLLRASKVPNLRPSCVAKCMVPVCAKADLVLPGWSVTNTMAVRCLSINCT